MEELPRFDLTKKNSDTESASPSKAEFSKLLAASLNLSTSEQSRVLAFKTKAPAPPEHHQSQLAALYTNNLGQAPNRRQYRHIPTTQDRILDGEGPSVCQLRMTGHSSCLLQPPNVSADAVHDAQPHMQPKCTDLLFQC